MVAKRNTEERRAQIVEGLLEVMATEGYEGATIVQIGRAAGLASGLVHYHFQNKEQILLALVARLVATIRDRYAARVSATSTHGERLHALIDAHVALGKDADPRAVVAWSVIGAEAVKSESVRTRYRQALEEDVAQMRAHVKACLLADGRSTAHAGRIAATIISTVEGALRIGAVANGVLPAGFASGMIRKLADALLEAEPSAARSAK